MKITVSKAQMKILRQMADDHGVRSTYISREATAKKLEFYGLINIHEERWSRTGGHFDYISQITERGLDFVKATQVPCFGKLEDGTACPNPRVLMQAKDSRYFCKQHGREEFYRGTKFKAPKFTAEV